MIRALIAVLAAVTVLCGVYALGRLNGHSACESRHRDALLAQIEAGQKLDEARRRVAQERDMLARELEEMANADPVIVERCLGPGRVRRLNSLR